MQADNHSVDSQTLLMRERRAIERAQGGDLAALEPVLAQHAESLFACVLGRVGERAQAEDLLKDTFLTALERIQGFVWQDRSIYHWLRQIALNKVLDHHRAVGRRKRMCQVLRDELTATAEPQTPAPSAALSAEEERRIAQQRIEETLSGLHARYAQAIRLRVLEERPREDVAREMGVTAPTFDVLLHRAITALKKALESSQEKPGDG